MTSYDTDLETGKSTNVKSRTSSPGEPVTEHGESAKLLLNPDVGLSAAVHLH